MKDSRKVLLRKVKLLREGGWSDDKLADAWWDWTWDHGGDVAHANAVQERAADIIESVAYSTL